MDDFLMLEEFSKRVAILDHAMLELLIAKGVFTRQEYDKQVEKSTRHIEQHLAERT